MKRAEEEALLELFADMRTFFDETPDPTGSRLSQQDRNRVSSATIKQFERWTDRCTRVFEATAKAARAQLEEAAQ